ncbi:MAG: TonB-dependent receptor plug domain-containing protein, partial [Opitutaceae bacterium]
MSNIPRLLTSGRCYGIAIVGALGVFLPILHSQTAPASATTTAMRVPTPSERVKYDKNNNGVLEADEQAAFEAGEKTDAVLLTPFEVSTSQDRGYAAGNTLVGGRTDTPLALTPSAISIMTKEFLDDFAITDTNEAAQWSMNVDLSGNPTQGPFGGDRFEANVRGAGGQGAGAYPIRDGLQQYWIADSYNSERFETVSGPNSAQSGLGGPGGLVGSSSKRPRFNNRSGSVSARVDSFDGYRGTFDYNVGFDRIAFRVNALHQNVKSIQRYTSNKQNGITLAASFKISSKTLLTAQYERSAEWNIQYRRTYGEQASFWNRTTVNLDNSALVTTGTGLTQISATTDRLTYNLSTGTLINYVGNQYQTTGLGYQIPWGGRPDLPQQYPGSANFKPGMGKDFFLGPIDSIADRDLNANQMVLEHTFTPNLSARLTWQGSDVDPTVPYSQGQPGDYRIDVNRLLPGGAVNPNYLRAFSEWTPNSQHQTDNLTEYAGQVNYRFAIPRWFDLKQSFNLVAGHRFKDIDAWDRRFMRNNNPAQPNPQNGANELRFRQYYGDKPGKLADILNLEAINKLSPGI